MDEIVGQALNALSDGGVLIVTGVPEKAGDGALAVSPRYFTTLKERRHSSRAGGAGPGDGSFDVVVTAVGAGGQGPVQASAGAGAAGQRCGRASGGPGGTIRCKSGAPTCWRASCASSYGSRLPDYMAPSGILVLDRLPLSPNGKVDVRQLPVPEAKSSGRAPSGPAEEALCALFAEVLQREAVSPDDGFFDLGGHSLLALRLLNLISARAGAELTLGQLFLQPTPAALAGHLAQFAPGGVA